MWWNNRWHVVHAPVAYFHGVLIKNLTWFVGFWKCCFNNFRNVLPRFVLTLRAKGGLNHFILRFPCFLLVLSLAGFITCWFYHLLVLSLAFLLGSLNPLFFNASECIGVAFWKISLIDHRSIFFYLMIWVTPSKLLLDSKSFYWCIQDDCLVSCTAHKCYHVNLIT